MEEVVKLVEAGFEFHCEVDGVKVFRKTKMRPPSDGASGVVVEPLGFAP